MTAHKAAPTLLRIAIAQLNPTVGDIAGNLAKAREARADAARQGADLLLLTELFISGYPPEDLVLKPAFLKACLQAVEKLAEETADGGPGVIIGFPRLAKTGRHNAVAVLDGGKIIAVRDKVDLPNYGEFDEKRVFDQGEMPGPVNFRGMRIGIPICEDIWGDLGVCETLAESGAEILLSPNGSPYHRGKVDVRHQVVLKQVIETGLPMIYANQLGGQDELVFDGASFAFNTDKSLAFQMSQFEEALSIVEWKKGDNGWHCAGGLQSRLPEREEADYRACMLGFRDYVNKNGFKNVVLGLSGGIDSAICAALAVDALGEERVRTIMLPYRYTSKDSLKDAKDCAEALGCRYDIVPIEEPVEGLPRRAGRYVRGHGIGHHRGKPAEPHARHDPDGRLQQVRLDGGDHRQQVGNVGRLRHALWRHERRLQSDQGPLQDGGLWHLALAQHHRAAGRARSIRRWSSRKTSSTRRRRPSFVPTRRTRIRCRPIRCSTTFWNAWSKRR